VNSSPTSEPDGYIESEVLDLNGVSLAKLRTLGGAKFNRALQHAVDQAGTPRFAKGGSCSSADFS
jgi:hypothetical protein